MWLRTVTGPDAGHSVEVTGELVLGRERGADVVVRDERASRRHASVASVEGGVRVRDLGSANGIFVGGARVTEVLLTPGRRFAIGETEFEVVAGPPSAAPRQPSLAAKRAAAEALAEAARKARGQRKEEAPDAQPAPTYSVIGRLIDQSTRGQRRVTWIALAVAAAAVVAVVLLVSRSSSEDRVPEVVRALAPSTVLVEVSAGRARTATGSGWVLDAADGLVVTNAHVVNAGTQFAVVASGRGREATIVASAPCEDLALLRLRDTAGLKAAPLGSSVEQGETVIALGYAEAGRALSATRGVVSSKSTAFEDPAPDVPPYGEVIQTDTSLNPGNSGGPLADLDGKVIGVNAAARTRGSDGRPLQNQNYAIPIVRARDVIAELRAGRSRAWLGATFGYPTTEKLAETGYPPGLYLTGAVPGTPAAESGLGGNALLVSVNGVALQAPTLEAWCDAVRSARSGTIVSLVLNLPSGKRREVRVRLA